jgi:hypothetical protein
MEHSWFLWAFSPSPASMLLAHELDLSPLPSPVHSRPAIGLPLPCLAATPTASPYLRSIPSQMAERDVPSRLTIRRRAGPPPAHPPPLENVILTRWPAAHVDWNGADVLP